MEDGIQIKSDKGFYVKNIIFEDEYEAASVADLPEDDINSLVFAYSKLKII